MHLWGRAAAVEELQSIADEHNLKLMFDAAHAFGCSYNGRMIGNFGEAEVLSFHATKFFHTFEGGAVLTNNDELAENASDAQLWFCRSGQCDPSGYQRQDDRNLRGDGLGQP